MVSTILIALIAALILSSSAYDKKQFERERKAWTDERKDLLSRIQARDLNEYTVNVIREKKAEQQEEPQEEIEFIS